MIPLDFLHVEASAGSYQYILVVMDPFTRYALAYATKDLPAKKEPEKVYNNFIFRFESLKQSTMTNAVKLRKKCFTIWTNFLELAIQELPLTTPRGMVRLNASAGHDLQCPSACFSLPLGIHL